MQLEIRPAFNVLLLLVIILSACKKDDNQRQRGTQTDAQKPVQTAACPTATPKMMGMTTLSTATPEESGQSIQSAAAITTTTSISIEEGPNVPNVETREAMLKQVNLAPPMVTEQTAVDMITPPPESATFISTTLAGSDPNLATPCP